MTAEQLNKYIGKKYSDSEDCYYWFREIMKNEYSIDMPLLAGNHKVFNAAKLIRDVPELLGGRRTSEPQTGDCVFLSLSNRPHHIGIYVHIDGKAKILHAIENSGVILSDMASLKLNGWKVREYWTLRSN